MAALGPFLYLTQHWMFAAAYFRIAAIFKLVFSVKCQIGAKLLQKREN